MKTKSTEETLNEGVIDHKEKFRTQGYTMIRGFFSPEETDELLEEIQSKEAVISKPNGLSRGEMLFYSNLFLTNDKIRQFISQPRLVDFLQSVIGRDFWVRWDQAVIKRPNAPEFPWHQDNAYNKLKNEHFQLWIALTRMNAERGGLWLIPGSHRNGLLSHKKVGSHQIYVGAKDNAVCIEAEKGDVLLFSSFLLHYTSPNVSPDDRGAYVVEYMSFDHHDSSIPPPYFVVAKNGNPHAEFERYPGGRSRYAASVIREKVSKLAR